MKLYQFSWGIYPRRIHIYLKEKGINDIEMIDLDVIGAENRTHTYLAKNPIGTIPTLETEEGFHLCQSTTILLYLEEKYPTPDMLGATGAARARTRDQLALINEAYNFAGICTFYGSPLFEGRREPSDTVAAAMQFEFGRVLESLQSLSGDAAYLGGETPSIADVAFFASEQFMRDLYKLQLPAGLTQLEGVYQRFSERPSAAPAPYPDMIVPLAPIRAFQA